MAAGSSDSVFLSDVMIYDTYGAEEGYPHAPMLCASTEKFLQLCCRTKRRLFEIRLLALHLKPRAPWVLPNSSCTLSLPGGARSASSNALISPLANIVDAEESVRDTC